MNRVLARFFRLQGSGFSSFNSFSFSSLLSLLVLWTGGGGGGWVVVHGEHVIIGSVIIEWGWRFAQHTFLVVVFAYNIMDVSPLL